MADRYLVQYRLVKLPSPDAEADRWSSATSTMTVVESSVPIDADSEQEAIGQAVDVVHRSARRFSVDQELGGG